MRLIALAAASLLAVSPACGAGKINYGSRIGMAVTVTSVSGIGTAHAVIHVRHTPEDAKAFCVGYSDDHSQDCINRTLREVRINDSISGNCVTGAFITLDGDRMRFLGEARHPGEMEPKYVIMNGREKLEGDVASGYFTVLDQFAALCPNRAQAGP